MKQKMIKKILINKKLIKLEKFNKQIMNNHDLYLI